MRIRGATGDYRWGVVATIVGTAALVGVMAPSRELVGLLNEGLAFLVLTLLVSATWGQRVGLFAAVFTNLALNFFFTAPYYTFTVRHPRDAGALVAFLITSLVAGSLLSRARSSTEIARRNQAETAILLDLSRDLIGRADPTDALTALCHNVVRTFAAPGASVLSFSDGGWSVLAHAGRDSAGRTPDATEGVLAQRSLESGIRQVLGRTGLGSERRFRVLAPGLRQRIAEVTEGVAFVPLRVGDKALGVLRLDGPIGETSFREHAEQLLDAFAREAALGVQRLELAHAARQAAVLRQADDLKTALMASVSHDLKTPLAGIKAAVSSLLDRSVSWSQEDIEAFLETVDSETDRLNRLISDILDLNRIESGVVRPASQPVSARRLLEEALDQARPTLAGRPVSIVGAEEPAVKADESLIVQALVNLLENAGKYSTPGGAIQMSAASVPSGVALSVSDSGPGIAERDLPYVFERFYRASDLGGQVKGSGLGLAIVKAFVTVAGGTVRVDSSPKGTTFTITLPAAMEPVAA